MKKLCIKCQQIKPINEFHKDSRRPDGLFPYCKRCRHKTPQKYDEQKENRAKGLHHCNNCLQWLDSSEFYFNPSTPDGIHRQCKACSKEQAKTYYHADKSRAQQKNHDRYWNNKTAEQKRHKDWTNTPSGRFSIHKRLHRRRVHTQLVENTLTEQEWIDILVSQNKSCLGCGRKFDNNLKPTMDHIMPLSKGGGLTKENIQALCRSCNSKKQAKTIDYRQRPSS